MLFKRFKKIFVAALSLSSLPLCGHFFKIQTLHNDAQNIILVSDYHYSDDPENARCIFKQQEDIIDCAQKLNALMIVEDGYIYNDHDIIKDTTALLKPEIIPVEEITPSIIQTPLHSLHSACAHRNIESINVESRFSSMRSTQNFLQYLTQKKNIVLAYNDPQQYKDVYQKVLARLSHSLEEPCKKTMRYLAQNPDVIGNIRYRSKRMDPVKKLAKAAQGICIDQTPFPYEKMDPREIIHDIYVHYGCMFLDLDILHAIAQNQHKKYIIVCAGDYHIDHCILLLKQLGYSLEHCIGQTLHCCADGIRFIEPRALEIPIILDIYSSGDESKSVEVQLTSFCMVLLNTFIYNLVQLIH